MSCFKSKMHQICSPLGLCSAPEHSTSPDSLAVLKGPTSNGREWKWRGEEERREGKAKERVGERTRRDDLVHPKTGPLKT